MNQAYFERMSNIAKKAQAPIKEMAELNIKTIQEMSYLKPDELTKLKKAEDVFDKHVELALENGKKAVNYVQQSFKIYEKALTSLLDEVHKKEKPTK